MTQAARPPGARDARLRRRHRPRGARHPARAARRRLRVGDLRRDRRSAARGSDARLPRAGRRHRRPTTCCIHHFSIGSRASRTAYALPGRMALIYHNITPPEYFVGVHKDLVKQCFRGRRELTRLHRPLRSRARRLGIQPPGARGARVSAHRRAAGRARLHATSTAPPDRVARRGLRRRVDEHHVRRPRHPEQEVRGRDPRLPRLSHATQPAVAAAARRLVQRLRAISRDAAGADRARSGTPDVHFLGHVSNEELTALYDVADLFLCASEHEGFCVPIIEAFYKRVPVLAYAATAVPATMDGGGVLYDAKDPLEIARADGGGARRRRARGRRSSQSQDAALARLRAQDFAGTLLRFVDQTARRARRRQAPEVAWDFWAAVRAVRAARGAAAVPAGARFKASRRRRPASEPSQPSSHRA